MRLPISAGCSPGAGGRRLTAEGHTTTDGMTSTLDINHTALKTTPTQFFGAPPPMAIVAGKPARCTAAPAGPSLARGGTVILQKMTAMAARLVRKSLRNGSQWQPTDSAE
jgi:hypothetical protein